MFSRGNWTSQPNNHTHVRLCCCLLLLLCLVLTHAPAFEFESEFEFEIEEWDKAASLILIVIVFASMSMFHPNCTVEMGEAKRHPPRGPPGLAFYSGAMIAPLTSLSVLQAQGVIGGGTISHISPLTPGVALTADTIRPLSSEFSRLDSRLCLKNFVSNFTGLPGLTSTPSVPFGKAVNNSTLRTRLFLKEKDRRSRSELPSEDKNPPTLNIVKSYDEDISIDGEEV